MAGWANGWVDWHYTVEPCDPADDPPDDVLPFDVAHHRQRCMLPTGEHRHTYIEMMWHAFATDYCEVKRITKEERTKKVINAVNEEMDIRQKYLGIKEIANENRPTPYLLQNSKGELIRQCEKAEGGSFER